MTKPTTLPIPGPSSADALAKSYQHPRLTPRIFEPRPNTEFSVLAFRLRRAIESGDLDLLKSAASAMTSNERLRALEKFEAEDLAKSETVAKGYWNPRTHRYDATEPGGVWSAAHPRPEQTREPAPPPTAQGPVIAPIEGTGFLRAMERGMTVWFELEGNRHHGKVLKWGKLGAQVVTATGDVAAVAWKDLHVGVHPDQLAAHEASMAKSHEAALRSGWARSQALGLWALDPAERVAFLKSQGA